MDEVLHSQRVLPERRTNLSRFLAVFGLSALIIVAVISSYLWSRLAVIRLEYRISSVDVERAGLENENKKLKLNLLQLKSPQRIESVARDKLGLIYPSGERIIFLK